MPRTEPDHTLTAGSAEPIPGSVRRRRRQRTQARPRRLRRARAAWQRPMTTPHRRRRAEPPAESLAAAERAALEQLAAADGYVTRWPVGRQVTRSLANRQLVLVASEYVLLTNAGRRALASDGQRRNGPAPPDPGRAASPARPTLG
jgi:hypothetical protein